MIGQPNMFISESEALQQCNQMLSQSDVRWQLFLGLLMIFGTFIIYLLYLNYKGRFFKISQQVEKISNEVKKYGRRR